MHFREHAHQGRAEKGARFLLVDKDVAGLRRDFRDDGIRFSPRIGHVFVGAATLGLPTADRYRIGTIFLSGRVEGWQVLLAGFHKQLADIINSLPAFLAAASAKALDGFENGLRLVADKIVIDVDDQ